MPAAMYLTVLVSLFAVTLSTDNGTSSTVEPVTTTPPGSVNLNSASTTNISSSDADNTEKPTTPANTTVLTTFSSPFHPNTTTASNTSETIQPSPAPEASTAGRETSYMHFSTTPAGEPETPNTTVNTSTTGVPKDFDEGNVALNPGLVAVLCIFCIVVGLLLVVVTVKCIRSPRSNFERLDDVPMNKVNEESPFAQYSK